MMRYVYGVGCAVLFIGLAVGLSLWAVRDDKPRPPAQVFYQPSGVELSPAGVQFARDFRGVVNAESVVAHSTRFVSHISCLTGDPNHFFCAWLVATPEGPRCYAGMVERDGTDIRPLGGSKDSVGRVPLTVARCGALNAIRSLK